MRVPYKKSTVHDVALKAGVSQSAVSHYINGRVSVCSPETAERINQAIKELHFTPSRALRHQRSQATNTIGVCVSLPSEDAMTSSSTFLHRFWTGISRVVDEHSYRLLHYPKSLRNSQSCNPYLDGSIDGLLISLTLDDRRIDTLCDAGMPTVAVNRSSNLPAGVSAVYANEEQIVDLAMAHFTELGHRRIAYFGPSDSEGRRVGKRHAEPNEPAQKRLTQYKKWMAKIGVDPTDVMVYAYNFDYMPAEDLYDTVDFWMALPEPPTALLCGNDRLAMSAMAAIKERGYRIPEDISVVGIDNEGSGAMFEPSLTSVELPVHEIGRQATNLLLDVVNGRSEPKLIEIPVTHLEVRSSTAPPKR